MSSEMHVIAWVELIEGANLISLAEMPERQGHSEI